MSKFFNVLFAIWLAPRLIRMFLWVFVILAVLVIGALSWVLPLLKSAGISGNHLLLLAWIVGLVIFAIVMVNKSREYPHKSPQKSDSENEVTTNRETSAYAGRMKQYRNEAERFLESRKNKKRS
jgi:type VI protein secretion system component VasK